MGGIHQAANAIKTFLRDMREPLLTHSMYSRILRFKLADQATNEREVRNMLLGLPVRVLSWLVVCCTPRVAVYLTCDSGHAATQFNDIASIDNVSRGGVRAV